jgi:hypothetical protein
MQSSIPDAFDPDDPVARCLLSMAMARNDIEFCLRDIHRATKGDDPDFAYRIRLLTAHFVEAALALRQYRQHKPELAKFLGGLDDDAKADLKAVTRTAQLVGPAALDQIRTSTFHYPHPDPNYQPDSDERLAEVVRELKDEPAHVYVNFETRLVHMSFADRVALALALGGHSTERAKLEQQLRLVRDGAFAFRRFVERVLLTFGVSFGEPQWLDHPEAGD